MSRGETHTCYVVSRTVTPGAGLCPRPQGLSICDLLWQKGLCSWAYVTYRWGGYPGGFPEITRVLRTGRLKGQGQKTRADRHTVEYMGPWVKNADAARSRKRREQILSRTSGRSQPADPLGATKQSSALC